MRHKTELKLNISVVLFSQVLMLVANFFTKQAILTELNAEYMGLQTVCANFCDLFTMAFSAAGMVMLYRLYKPLEERDTEKISAVFRHFRNVFRRISFGAVGVGVILAIVTLLCVDTSISEAMVLYYYWLYLVGILAYNGFLYNYYMLMADQKRYVAAGICGIVDIIALGFEIAVIVNTHRYAAFLMIIIFKNLAENFFIRAYRKKNYGYIKSKGKVTIDEEEKKNIARNIYDMVISKIGQLLLYNSDSIIISAIVSTTISGFYSCYYFIVYGIQFTMTAVFDTIIPKIGQWSVRLGRNKQFRNYIRVSALNILTTTICVAGFYLVCEDFIVLWVGKSALLDNRLITIIAINLYISMTRYTSSAFRQAEGLFQKISGLILFRGIFNIVLSILMGWKFGLLGIIAATSISDGLTVYWYEPYMVLKYYGKKMRFAAYYEIIAIFSVVSAIYIAGKIIAFFTQVSWLFFILKVVIIVIVSAIWVAIVLGTVYLIYYVDKQRLDSLIDGDPEPVSAYPPKNTKPVKISFILPVYNGAAYVLNAINSVIKEKEIDFELLVIDDGSTDNTLNLVKELEKTDSRIRVIHTENQGQGFARNVGIRNATGDYIGFIDADDIMLWDGMKKLVSAVNNNRWDVVIGNYYKENNRSRTIGIEGLASGILLHGQSNIYDMIKTKSLFGYCWNKLFRTEMVLDNMLEFSDVNKVYMEDTLFCLKAFSCSEYCYICEAPVYLYRIIGNSFSRKPDIRILEKSINLLNEYGEYLDVEKRLESNWDLLVPLYMRVFCWAQVKTMQYGEKDTNDIRKNILSFTEQEAFRKVISDKENMKELDRIDSWDERLLFKTMFKLLYKEKYDMLVWMYKIMYPLFKAYISIVKIR